MYFVGYDGWGFELVCFLVLYFFFFLVLFYILLSIFLVMFHVK